MFHPNTQWFIDDWRARRGDHRLPARADLAPAAFGRIAPQLFMLGTEADGRDLFRLAGGFLIDLHGRPLQGSAFAELWRLGEQKTVTRALTFARRNAAPVVLSAEANARGGEAVGIEIVLAPVLGPTGGVDRTFGLYQPTAMVARLRGEPVQHLAIRAITPAADGSAAPGPRLVALDGRRVA